MKINLEPDRYIVAVSGGVDSVVLLYLLTKIPELDLVVAHFDHGIRAESADDESFVKELAGSYGLVYESRREELGDEASEELARQRRYAFLEEIKSKYSARAIITAHHRDDVAETVLINVMRGTGRKGLSSLYSSSIVRPLLSYSKSDIVRLAHENNLAWREDSTNSTDKYLRNKLRRILQNEPPEHKDSLVKISEDMQQINQEIDDLLDEILREGSTGTNSIDRNFFIALDYAVQLEFLAFWLRQHNVDFNRRLLHMLCIALKTARINTMADVDAAYYFKFDRKQISLEVRSSV